MRISGGSFQEIADELGYASRGAAFDAYKKGYAALTEEIQAEAQDAIRHQLLRNKSYRRRVLIQANESGDQISGSMAALQIDKFDAALRGLQPGPAANLDAVPAIAGPAGTAGAVCAKCGAAATGALTDPKFETERIQTINAILMESNAHLVPLKATDDGWDGADQGAPAPLPAQIATPRVPEGSGVRFARITDRETHDLVTHDFRDNEIL